MWWRTMWDHRPGHSSIVLCCEDIIVGWQAFSPTAMRDISTLIAPDQRLQRSYSSIVRSFLLSGSPLVVWSDRASTKPYSLLFFEALCGVAVPRLLLTASTIPQCECRVAAFLLCVQQRSCRLLSCGCVWYAAR